MSSLRAGPWAHRASLVAHSVVGFSPRDTSPDIWIDAEMMTGLADGDPVGTVPDISGHGRNFVPNGSAPLWVASGPDGPAFLFDGIDDSLQWYAPGLTLTPPFTVLAVARNTQGTDDASEHTIWDLTSGGNEYALRAFFTYGPGPWFAHYGPVGTGSLVTTIPATDTSWRVWTVEVGELGSVRTQGRFDVAYQPTGYGGKPFNSGAVNIGSRVAAQRPWKGYIRAVLFWNRALSAIEKYNLERYYGVKRGITITPHVPTDVVGTRFWSRADSLALAAGASVPQWDDSSGYANHITEPQADFRPTWWDRAVLGLPAVRFSAHRLSRDTLTITQPSMFFFCGTIDPPPDGVAGFLYDHMGNGARQASVIYPTQISMYAGGEPKWDMAFPTGPLVLSEAYNSTTSKLYRNGVVVAPTQDAGPLGLGSLRLGMRFTDNFPVAADYVDTVLVSGDASDLSRLKIEDYLLRRILL